MKSLLKNPKMDVIKYFITKVLSGLLSFVLVSLYTYYMEPEIYGDYSLIIGIINVITCIFIGWISSSSLRYYTAYKDDKCKFFTNIFIQWLVMIILSFIVILLFGLVSSKIKIIPYFYFVIMIMLFHSTQDILNSIIRASKKTNLYLIITIGQYVITILLFMICFIKLQLGIKSLFISNIVSYMMLTIICILYFKIYKYINIRKIDTKFQLKIIKYGLPMVGVWGINWILGYSDRYIINEFCSSYEVGLYDIASKISENSINMIITALSMALFPTLIDKYNKNGKEEAEKTLGKFLKYYFIVIIPAVVGLISIRGFIYGTIISEKYIYGMNVIIYISLSMLFTGFNQFIYKLWQLIEKTKMILFFIIPPVILNIILNIILIPKYGYIIAAVTTLISTASTTIIALLYTVKEFKLIIDHKTIIKTTISSLIMGIFISQGLVLVKSIILKIVVMVLGTIIYFIILLLSGVIKEEIGVIYNILKKKKEIHK